MTHWDYSIFNEKLGKKCLYAIILGKPCSGKSTIAKQVAQKHGYELIDMKAVEEKIKESLGNPEEPFEGTVPIKDIEKKIVEMMKDDS